MRRRPTRSTRTETLFPVTTLFRTREGVPVACTSFVLQCYFGVTPTAQTVFDQYPFGGLGEYMIAPANSIVVLPDNISFQEAARFGYLGTASSELRKGRAGPTVTTLITGGSGTLGLGAVLLALAMGGTKILAGARNPRLCDEVSKLTPRHTLVPP